MARGRREGRRNGVEGVAARTTKAGAVFDRISWTPMPDGRIVQAWETSPNGAPPWTRIFVGYYRKAAGTGANSTPGR
ncbi:MAG: hypothetical protein WD825_05150 [Gemmatimonadaceae bacterium]